MHRLKFLAGLSASLLLTFAVCTGVFAEIINLKLYYDGKNHNYSAGAVNIVVDGEEITGLDMPPVILNERTLIPARAVFEAVGANVDWNGNARQVYVSDDENVVVLTIDNKTAYKNGNAINMDVAPKIINDRTMIPVRYAAEALDCEVGWDDISRTVTIKSKNYLKEDEIDVPVINPGNDVSGEISGKNIKITGIVLPDEFSSSHEFIIKANGEISKFDDFILTDDRLIVDIYNAELAVSNNSISVSRSSVVKAVRSAQFQTEPEKIARVVFDLASVPEYDISLSSDKRQIKVSFDTSYVKELEFSEGSSSDKIVISSDSALSYEIFQSVDPNTLTVDIYGAESMLDSFYNANGNFVNGINTYHGEGNALSIVINTKDIVSFEDLSKGNDIIISVKESTLKNISYSKDDNAIILKNSKGLERSDFTKKDSYLNRQYIITLDGDYENTYGYGKLFVNDSDGIKSFEIQNNSKGDTEIIINESTVLEFLIEDFSKEIRIKGVNPKEVYDKVILIDPGHGKQDPGASGNGVIEKNANLGVVKYLNGFFENDGDFKVYATRLDDSYPANADRAKLANEIADLFISVHMNSALNAEAKGTEVLYMNHSNESQYSGMVTSKKMALEIQKNLIDALGTEDRGIKERTDLIVLNSTKVPAVLVEVLFISNPEDASIIDSEKGKEAAAEAIYDAIVTLSDEYDLR